MAATSEFTADPHPIEWKNILKSYNKALKVKCDKKSKPSAAKELQDLDEWYQKSLPKLIAAREDLHITSDELVKLMKWKLSRGKFRPRLVDLAASNKNEDVIKISTKAFKQLGDNHFETAIKVLSSLKGIGPATASAILTAGAPERAAFMADESVAGVLGDIKLQYTVQEYMVYMDGIDTIKAKLNRKDNGKTWTAHEVELCLWTHRVAEKLGVDLDVNGETDKRKTEDDGDGAKKKIKN